MLAIKIVFMKYDHHQVAERFPITKFAGFFLSGSVYPPGICTNIPIASIAVCDVVFLQSFGWGLPVQNAAIGWEVVKYGKDGFGESVQ